MSRASIEDESGQKKRVFSDAVFHRAKKVCGTMTCSSNAAAVYNKLQETDTDTEVKLFVVTDGNNYEHLKSNVFKT